MPDDSFFTQVKMSLSRRYIQFLSRFERFQTTLYNWHDARLENLNQRTAGILVLTFLLSSLLYMGLFRPDVDFPTEHYITIEQGDDLGSIASMLAADNVVRNAHTLELAVRMLGGSRSVHAGDYLFAHPVGTFAIARAITTGTYGLEPIRITIPEGATVVDMAVIYDKRLFKFDPQHFVDIALPYEGYLYPDTYYFLPNVREDEVMRTMNDNFKNHIAEFAQQIDDSPYTFHEIITLASIIEKEAWKPRDQKKIAGVLYNRLDKGMKLQVDATFTYTHNKGTYQITLDDLADEENPYNTYVHKGLPPGPIAAVGHSALDAALNPTKSNYLFYLADRHGNTYYSTTYAEHLKKKRRYVD